MAAIQDQLFHGLADGTRRAIFERLATHGELSVGALTLGSGVSQPAVSKHLGELKRAGLVSARPAGRQTFYRAEPGGLSPLVDWMAIYRQFWAGKFEALDDLLKRMDQ